MLLKDKVVLVTGASRGIGRATALLLAEHGAKVILNGRNGVKLQTVATEITNLGFNEATILPYNVADVSAVKEAFQTIKKEYGQLDVLVNNAGILSDGLLGMLRPEQVSSTMAVNVHAVIYHMQFASRLMMKQKKGSIINVSSIMGVEGEIGQTVYSASKAAIIGATKSVAKELAQTNIRVNAVAPGFIETDMTQSLDEVKYNERLESIKMKRAGQPEEVANGILFLASSMSSYVTGHVLQIDGGMVI
ncbi:MAG: SDR family oxidoreductase [Bacillaceae bacterium]|nr:SDR family oxidoreductase [Bacillaceae bacterium]